MLHPNIDYLAIRNWNDFKWSVGQVFMGEKMWWKVNGSPSRILSFVQKHVLFPWCYHHHLQLAQWLNRPEDKTKPQGLLQRSVGLSSAVVCPTPSPWVRYGFSLLLISSGFIDYRFIQQSQMPQRLTHFLNIFFKVLWPFVVICGYHVL